MGLMRCEFTRRHLGTPGLFSVMLAHPAPFSLPTHYQPQRQAEPPSVANAIRFVRLLRIETPAIETVIILLRNGHLVKL